jgi:hypothetical protein
LSTIVDYSPTKEVIDARVDQVARWKLTSNESFLMSMLMNRHDFIAAEYGEYYPQNIEGEAGYELMKYAITNSNEIFLKYAFKNGLFPDFLTKENSERVEELLSILNQGTQVELILNIFIYADMENWSGQHLKDFIEIARNIISGEREQNLMYCCYNPILAICLVCESLDRIGGDNMRYHIDPKEK